MKDDAFLKKMTNAFKGIFKKKTKYNDFVRFKEFLDIIDKKSSLYKRAEAVVLLCNESLDIVYQREIINNRLVEIEKKLKELDEFNNLNDEELDYLKKMLSKLNSVSKDFNFLRHQVTGFNKSVVHISELEEEAPEMINELSEAENKQRIFKQDMGYLQGEKSELEYERERLVFLLGFIYKFTIGLVIVFGLAACTFVLMYVFKSVDVLFPLTVLFLLVIVIATLLFIFRRRLTSHLKLNEKKQIRAVGMLNTKSVVYAHYTNFLNYEYKKFKVKNSEMLKNNLKEYSHYKHLSKRYEGVKSIKQQIEDDLDKFLVEKNINSVTTTLEKFAQTIDIDERIASCRLFTAEKNNLTKELAIADARQEKLAEALFAAVEESKNAEDSQTDDNGDDIIAAIVMAYNDEASRRRPIISELE